MAFGAFYGKWFFAGHGAGMNIVASGATITGIGSFPEILEFTAVASAESSQRDLFECACIFGMRAIQILVRVGMAQERQRAVVDSNLQRCGRICAVIWCSASFLSVAIHTQ